MLIMLIVNENEKLVSIQLLLRFYYWGCDKPVYKIGFNTTLVKVLSFSIFTYLPAYFRFNTTLVKVLSSLSYNAQIMRDRFNTTLVKVL